MHAFTSIRTVERVNERLNDSQYVTYPRSLAAKSTCLTMLTTTGKKKEREEEEVDFSHRLLCLGVAHSAFLPQLL